MTRINLEDFPDDIHYAAKAEALSQRLTLKQYIISLICRDLGLTVPEQPKTGPKPKL